MPDMASARRVCASGDLADGGRGVRFTVAVAAREAVRDVGAFVIRYDGVAHGYLNQCAHVPMEMDWQEGQFFDSAGLYLMCATHGAVYAPDTGQCMGGPCRGATLAKLRIEERDGSIYWLPEPPFFPPEPNESIA